MPAWLFRYEAIWASYAAVRANASAASFWRVSGLTVPCVRMSRRTDAYWVGSETAATPGKFLAAARSSATPPMSIFSSAWSSVVPGSVTVCPNG